MAVMLYNAFRCPLPDHYTNETEIGKEGERDIGLYIKQTVFTVWPFICPVDEAVRNSEK